jgi:hypothetical protein
MMSLQGSLSIERMCELARVSRASFYRWLREQRPAEEETEVRSVIHTLTSLGLINQAGQSPRLSYLR